MSKFDIQYEPADIKQGTVVKLAASTPGARSYRWRVHRRHDSKEFSDTITTTSGAPGLADWNTRSLDPGEYTVSASAHDEKDSEIATGEAVLHVAADLGRLKENFDRKMDALTDAVSGPFHVMLQRSAAVQTADQPLWSAVRRHAEMVSFRRYNEFIHRVLCDGSDVERSLGFGAPTIGDRRSDLASRATIYGVDAYDLLRTATEVFLILECGVNVRADPLDIVPAGDARLDPNLSLRDITNRLQQYLGVSASLPYLTRIVEALLGSDPAARAERLPHCHGILRRRFTCPSLLELIWSYWHEEGMLVQTLNAIALRFQNRHRGGGRDPLAHLAIDPLRPLNNLLWGYIQSEYKRLSVPRRAYEYDHHYGLTLYGKAVPSLRSADSRSKFLEAFHNLLYRTSVFYQEDADTTVVADGFPLLTALREVHLLLAEGAHNQFGDLPWTARVEMLIEQWLLARPEMTAFLRGRAMVPYTEAWMGPVDTMKNLQGWSDTTITHFNNLAVWGEQILLSIRYGDWISINDQDQARNWARYWRPEIQGYIHAYRAATGVDLAVETAGAERASNRDLQPSIHLRNRLAEQQRRAGRV